MPDFLRDADLEAAIGLSGITGLAVRLDPEDSHPANDVVKSLLEDSDGETLLKLVVDEPKLLQRLDDKGYNLVIHEVAKAMRPDSEQLDNFLTNPLFDLVLQDAELNTSLHYMADNGIDLTPNIPFRYLLLRNAKGATVLHILAKNPALRERLLALPQNVLDLRTVSGVRIEDVLNYKAPDSPTPLQILGR